MQHPTPVPAGNIEVPTIGAGPKFKVILVKESMNEFEDLITKGWRMANVMAHPKGAIIVLAK